MAARTARGKPTDWLAYLRGEKSMPAEDRELLGALTRKAGYLSLLSRTNTGEPFPFYDYQRYFFSLTQRFAGMDKSRQAGGSEAMAYDALGNAMCVDRSTSLLVSYNLDEAMEKIRRVQEAYDAMPTEGKKRATHRTKMSIEFSNGARVLAVYKPRGFGPAFVYWDEAAFSPDGDDIMRAAVFALLRGGYLRMVSTHFGKRNIFWRIRSRDGGQYRNWLWLRVPWWHCPALCKDVKGARQLAPHLLTEERVATFGTSALREIFESMPLEDFQQECECTPVDDTTAYFTEELIRSVQMEPDVKAVESLAKLRGLALPLVAGYDVGRKRNASELTVMSQHPNDILREQYFKTYLNVPFEEQRQELRIFMLACPLAKIAIDRTGIGEDLAESLETEFGDRVLSVHFGSGNTKERLVVLMRLRMERGQDQPGGIRLIRDRQRFRQLHSIRRKVGEGGARVTYDVASGERHHADKAFSQMLAVYLGAGTSVSIAEYVAPSRPYRPEATAAAEIEMQTTLGSFARVDGLSPDKIAALEERFHIAVFGRAAGSDPITGEKSPLRDFGVRVYSDGRISQGFPESEPCEDP